MGLLDHEKSGPVKRVTFPPIIAVIWCDVTLNYPAVVAKLTHI